MRKSITKINYILLIGFIVLNIGLIISIIFFTSNPSPTIFLVLTTLLNITMFSSYWFINTRYWIEHDRLFHFFSSFIRDKKNPETIPQTGEFDENTQFLSLFKRTYIEHNLLKKDYADFKKVFDTFIPQEIHEKIGFRGYEKIVLGASQKKRLTIMFLDIMKFTTMSESIADPQRALLLLNIYFDGIGEIIYSHHGYIDKYLGDGILAIFDDDHTDDALAAAIEIQEFIKKFHIYTMGKYIDIGIGINTGNVTVGTIGTQRRMDMTVIGDVVNTASRIENLTRTTKSHILLSEDTHASLLHPELYDLEDMGELALRGKNEKIRIYGVIPGKEE